jgi:hypothetical protein
MVFSNLLNDFTRTNAPTSTIHFKPGNTHTVVEVTGAVSSGSSATVDLKWDSPADGEPTQSYIPVIPANRSENLPALFETDVRLLEGR